MIPVHAIIPLLVSLTVAAAGPSRLFDVQNRPARRAVVMTPGEAPPAIIPDSAMLRRLAGVIDVLSKDDIAAFRRSINTNTRIPPEPDITRWLAVLHLYPVARPRHARTTPPVVSQVEIDRVEHGWYLARSLETGEAVRLESGVIEPILSRWTLPPAPPADDLAPGETAELPGPYTPSPIRLDEKTVSDRFSRGGRPIFPEPMSRRLADERFVARRPVGHNPARPAGLLVWISPTDGPGLPEEILPAADELGLIVISPANAGNDRLAVDRIQLALDAVATASARWWIDPGRVDIAGMSGGGRIASMLWSCFPDVFTGGVGVVGMNSQHLVGIGDGRYWPKAFTRPSGPLGRSITGHRFAAVTGPRDFNFNEIRARARLLRRAGLDVRVFDFEDQTHAMPTPEHFKQALTWVHRRHLDDFAKQTKEADRLMNVYTAKFGDAPPKNNRARRMLERITEVGSWTEPAWHAAELLGYAKAAASSADPGSPSESVPDSPSPPP